MENFGLGGGATLVGVFLLCTCVGIIAGSYIKHQVGDANAATTNITVTNNNQISTIDQGTPTIVRTSTVTIKDTSSSLGYRLSARIENNSIPSSTVTIYSTTSTICTQSSPCTITNNGAPTLILETNNNNATQAQGHTTQWTVTITLPQNTPQGNYITDIAYTQDPILPPPGPQEPNPSTPTTYGAMQLMTNAECSTTRGTAFDARNNQTYYVQKIAGLCWMETNLRYGGDGVWDSSWNYPDDRYATTTVNAANTANPNDNTRPLSTTTSGWLGGSTTTQYQQAGYFNPGGSTDYTNTTANGGFYGYLYNWCAAMGGQATACQGSVATQPDQNVSICPAGWRIPTGGSAGEFNSLNIAVNGGATNTEAGLRTNFLAVYSGSYGSSLGYQGSYGLYWSSSVYSATYAYTLGFYTGSVGPANYTNKYNGYAVRCVL